MLDAALGRAAAVVVVALAGCGAGFASTLGGADGLAVDDSVFGGCFCSATTLLGVEGFNASSHF